MGPPRPLVLSLALLLAFCPPALSLDRSDAFVGYSEVAAAPADDCEDESPNCSDWAQGGECDKNPGYMHDSCAASCGKCPPPGVRRERPPRPSGIDEDVLVLGLGGGHGKIRIRLLVDDAPLTVQRFVGAARGGCGTCELYRSEAVPDPGVRDNFGGVRPYALVQGRMVKAGPGGAAPPKEHSPVVRRGMVAAIQGGPDFFIAVGDHKEWGHAHTVWGEVLDMGPVDEITRLPVREEVWGQTHVTTLVDKIPFEPRLELGTA